MPLIEFDAVSHDYPVSRGTRTVLRDVTVRLTEPRIAVIGANGSGKSTFARMLNALVVPTSGRVRVDGLDTARTPARSAAGSASASPTPTPRS